VFTAAGATDDIADGELEITAFAPNNAAFKELVTDGTVAMQDMADLKQVQHPSFP
jgi:hypothetical protein